MSIETWREKWTNLKPVDAEGRQAKTFFCASVDKPEDRHFVIKIVEEEDESTRHRLRNEIKALEELDHENIVRFVDANPDDYADPSKQLYLVTERVAGPALCDVVNHDRPMPWNQAFDVTTKLLKAIQYCHERDVIHRDIKQEHIRFRTDDFAEPVILDFGLTYNKVEGESSLTLTEGKMGNASVRLWEHGRGSPKEDKRTKGTDIAQIMAMHFFMLSGESVHNVAWERGNKAQYRIFKWHNLLPIEDGWRSEELIKLYDWAFEPEPAARPSAEDALRQLGFITGRKPQDDDGGNYRKRLSDLAREVRQQNPAIEIKERLKELAVRFNSLCRQKIISQTRTEFLNILKIIEERINISESGEAVCALKLWRDSDQHEAEMQIELKRTGAMFYLSVSLQGSPSLNSGNCQILDDNAEQQLRGLLIDVHTYAIREFLSQEKK